MHKKYPVNIMSMLTKITEHAKVTRPDVDKHEMITSLISWYYMDLVRDGQIEPSAEDYTGYCLRHKVYTSPVVFPMNCPKCAEAKP